MDLEVLLRQRFGHSAFRPGQREIVEHVSQGQDATPLWIPQIPMALGTTVLALTFVDHFIRILFFGLDGIGGDAASAEERV